MTREQSKSSACNSRLLTILRKELGWTQSELARVTGFSERLIRKAEAGKPIAYATIQRLAEALSQPDHPVLTTDLTNDPVSKARAFVDGMYLHREHVVDKIEYFLHENIVCFMAGDPNIFPFAGEHHGIEGMRSAFQQFFNVLEPPPDHDHAKHYEYVSDGKNVVIWGQSYMRPIGGETPETPVNIMIHMKFENGKLMHMDDRYDTEEARKSFQ